MNDLTIKTNGQYRNVLSWWDLTDKERLDFDYLDTDERQLEASFMRYRGQVYDLHEFMHCREFHEPNALSKWHGYRTDTYFSGVLVRYSKDYESVKAATYFS